MLDDITVDINGEKLHWRNDPHLRPAETKLAYTKEHLLEYRKCSKDVVYFAENYVYINDPNKGRTLITLYPFQKKLLKQLDNNKYNIVMIARQQGKCSSFWTKINVRNIKTGKSKTVCIGIFYIIEKIKQKIKHLLAYIYDNN
jgi:hypothetical protein